MMLFASPLAAAELAFAPLVPGYFAAIEAADLAGLAAPASRE